MKKFITTMILVISILMLAVSCSQSPRYEVLEFGDYNSFCGANHNEDVKLEMKTHRKTFVDLNKTVNINGTEYDVEYYSSMNGYLYKNDIDYYSSSENGILVDLGLNSSTGRIDSYSWVDRNYLDEIFTAELTREECLDIAKEYLGDYIDDVSNYELTDEKYLTIPEYKAVYNFEFSRIIDGIKTSDSAYIGVTVYGTVITHVFISLGEMKDADLPSENDLKTINDNVGKKIEAIYNNVVEEYDLSYKVDDTVFVRLSDGKYALEYFVTAELKPLNSSDSISEQTHLLVYLD